MTILVSGCQELGDTPSGFVQSAVPDLFDCVFTDYPLLLL